MHTSYYKSDAIRRLIALHILGGSDDAAATTLLAKDDEIVEWYRVGRTQAMLPPPRQPTLQPNARPALTAFWEIGAIGLVALLWLFSSAQFRASVLPLTAEYQIDAVLADGSRLVPSAYYTKLFPWLHALTVAGRLDRAHHDALSVLDGNYEGARAEALIVVGATLRATGQETSAAQVESEATNLVPKIPNDYFRTNAAKSLARELGATGRIDPRVLDPHTLYFEHNDNLARIAGWLADSGHPDAALKTFPLDKRNDASAIEPVINALLKADRKARSARADQTGRPHKSRDSVPLPSGRRWLPMVKPR